MTSAHRTLATIRRAYRALLVLPLAILGGCSAESMTRSFGYLAGPAADPKVAEFAPGRILALPLPADFGRTVEAAQMLSARYDGQTFLFEGRISITPQRLVLVGVDAMGRRAMTATWDGRSLNIESAPWLPASVRPGSMLADIVILYWPEAAVRKALASAGCKLIATVKSREVRCDN